ncbi:ClbS/DfsB family four-helix bundle protein [Ekhidna sp.]
MAIPINKEELISAIEINYDKLHVELEDIPVELVHSKTLEGHAKGTKMSVSDLVAYLIGWGELVLKWNRKISNGEEVDFPETGYKWNELGQLASKFYGDYENLNFNSRLSKLEKTKDEILKLIGRTTNSDLYEKPWYNKWTQGRMIQLNTSSPFRNARNRLRKWKKLNDEN